jgi:phage protein D
MRMSSAPLVVSTSPVFEIEGQVYGELANDVIRLEIEEDTGGMKSLRCRLGAVGPQDGEAVQGLRYLDGQILDFGRKVNVSIGASGEDRTIFQGYISAVEVAWEEGVPPQVQFCAEDKLMNLRMTRRFRTYERMTDAQMAEAIASEHGLSASVDAEGPEYERVQQWNLTDLAFLRERGAMIQAELWLTEDTLYFQTRDKRAGTELTLRQGNELMTVTARADLAHQRTSLTVSGYDVAARDLIDEEAAADAIEGETSGGISGVSILERAFGERKSYQVRQSPFDAGEASAWARAEMLRRARSFVRVSGMTNGTPDMVVGSRVTLDGVGIPFDGAGYYVTSVLHSYDRQSAHRTRFTAERPTATEGA